MEEKQENKIGEGLIPQMIKKWKWRNKFTKEERLELDEIRKESFMRKMREKARIEGEMKADEEV